VVCNNSRQVGRIILNNLRGPINLNNTVNAALPTLHELNLCGNGFRNMLSASIAGCEGLDSLSGVLLASISRPMNLHTLDVSRNGFADEVPIVLSELNKLCSVCGRRQSLLCEAIFFLF
jgi:hypothetical protein